MQDVPVFAVNVHLQALWPFTLAEKHRAFHDSRLTIYGRGEHFTRTWR